MPKINVTANIFHNLLKGKNVTDNYYKLSKTLYNYPTMSMFEQSKIIKKLNTEQNLYFINNYKKGQTLCQK